MHDVPSSGEREREIIVTSSMPSDSLTCSAVQVHLRCGGMKRETGQNRRERRAIGYARGGDEDVGTGRGEDFLRRVEKSVAWMLWYM